MSITIEQIKQLNAAKGFYYFEPDTMRFFQSKAYEPVYATAAGDRAYFVTSEKRKAFQYSSGDYDPGTRRLFSVRVCDMIAGGIETAPGTTFQQFKSRRNAQVVAKALAGSAT